MNKPYAFFRLFALSRSPFKAPSVQTRQCTLLSPIHTPASSGMLAFGTNSKAPLSLCGHQGRKSKCNEPGSRESEVRHFPAKSRTHLFQSWREWVKTRRSGRSLGTLNDFWPILHSACLV